MPFNLSKSAEHPFRKIQRLLLDESNQRISQLETRQKKLESRVGDEQERKEELKRFLMDELHHYGGLSGLLKNYGLGEDRYFIRRTLRYSIMFSLIFSMIFIVVATWIILNWFRPLTMEKHSIAGDNNSALYINRDSTRNDRLNRLVQQEGITLEWKEFPDSSVAYFRVYTLRDPIVFYDLINKLNLWDKPWHFYFPVDFISQLENHQFAIVGHYLPVKLVPRLDENRLQIVSIQDTLPLPLRRMLAQMAGPALELDYQIYQPEPVYFEAGSDQLSDQAQQTLTEIAHFMQSFFRLRLKLIGHADQTGSEPLNKELSCRRAENAQQFLMSRQISANRLLIECFSNLQTVRGDPAINRRVEFEWIWE